MEAGHSGQPARLTAVAEEDLSLEKLLRITITLDKNETCVGLLTQSCCAAAKYGLRAAR